MELNRQRHSWHMENILACVFAQIKWTYSSTFTREIFRSEDNIKVLVIIGGLRMEFTCDDDALNLFTILATGITTKHKVRSPSQRLLSLTMDDGTTLSGHYTHHAALMHTHFRFQPTRDGMLALLKLVDYAISRMVAAAVHQVV